MATRETPPQRALVLQGSVALGAFEAGVFKALYDKLFRPGEQLFDIVAGTSAGAINAAILVSYVKENKTWEGSAERLEEYWRDHLSSPTPLIGNFGQFWLGEAARRYYSTKYFFAYGAPGVFFPSLPFPSLDFKFFDNNPLFPPTNLWLKYSNQPLRYSLERRDKKGQRFINFPLKTTEGEPRFLAVSVDVKLGRAVTFDSYSNVSRFESYYDPKIQKSREYVINYEQGIMPEHVMASASYPVFFDYQPVNGRRFWDGGLLSNTPLREVLQAHRDYWHKDREFETVPDLDVYVVNVWPSEEKKTIPLDHDGVKDRRNDITYADKTEYDQKIALVVTDYVDFINQLRDIATDAVNAVENAAKKRQLKTKLDGLLEKKGKSFKRTGIRRNYGDLIKGRFNLNQVITIERKDDLHNISNKWADYTSETINMLIREGEDYERTAIVRAFPPPERVETSRARHAEA